MVGIRNGLFVRHPASPRRREVEGGDEQWNLCQTFDPRLRPWCDKSQNAEGSSLNAAGT